MLLNNSPAESSGNAPLTAALKYAGQGCTPCSVQLTRITSTTPCNKRVFLDELGSVKKEASGLAYGQISTWQGTLSELGSFLNALKPNDTLVYGLPTKAGDRLAPQDSPAIKDGLPGHIARTRENFSYPDGPALFMLDYDPENETVLSRDALLEGLYRILPEARGCGFIDGLSAGSCIVNDETLQEVIGERGRRILLAVAHGTDIPRLMEIVQCRAWRAGFGHIVISKAGVMLPRSLFDGCTAQPERLDYLAGAHCVPPLRQNRPPFCVTPGPAFDSTKLADLTNEERTSWEAQIDQAKAETADAALRVRKDWAKTHAGDLAQKRGISTNEAYQTLLRAGEHHTLYGDFPLYLSNGTEIAVADLYADPAKYADKVECADPLEPDYHSSNRRVAVIYQDSNDRFRIYSQAHGGQRYALRRAVTKIDVAVGDMGRAVEQTLVALRNTGQYFERSEDGAEKAFVHLSGNYLQTMNDCTMMLRGEEVAEYYRTGYVRDEVAEKRIDMPERLAKTILKMGLGRKFPLLKGLLSAACVLPDGRVLDQPGYDAASGLLLLDETDLSPIGLHPSVADVQEAVQMLWKAFKDFPFVDATAAGVHFAALLTAGCRAGLPCAPGFVYTAPEVGTGKTLLVKCVGNLLDRSRTLLSPSTNETELKKVLLTVALDGTNHVIFDNLTGHLDSPSLAAASTSGMVEDRILGRSEKAKVPFNKMMLLTGNNITLSADMSRRFLQCRLDTQTERPYTRCFELDPDSYTREHRQQLVQAAITVLLGYRVHGVVAGHRWGKGSTASFEVWDEMVRQAVCWLAVNPELCGGLELADPIGGIEKGMDEDPERERLDALLSAIWEWRGDKPFTTADIAMIYDGLRFAPPPCNREVAEAAAEIAPITGGRLNTRALGRWLAKNKGRIVNGLKLEPGAKMNTGGIKWQIACGGTPRPRGGTEPLSVTGAAVEVKPSLVNYDEEFAKLATASRH